jgi:hypothetical protein
VSGREVCRFQGLGAAVTALAFAPDGRRLVSGLSDSTLLVWDVGAVPAAPAGKFGAEAAARAWDDLGDADGVRALRARWALAAAPVEAVALVKRRLPPARLADAVRLLRLLKDLGSERFAVRDKAQAELAALGEAAEPALRQALTDEQPLEIRRRLQKLLDRLSGPLTRPEARRAVRAVALLESLGTPAARAVLEELAGGVAGARLAREARAARERLDRKPASEGH